MVVRSPPSKASGGIHDQLSRIPGSNEVMRCDPQDASHLYLRPSLQKPPVRSFQSLTSTLGEAQAWFTGYYDKAGKLHIVTPSPFLESRLGEVFPPTFHQSFARAVRDESSFFCDDPAVTELTTVGHSSLPVESSSLPTPDIKHATRSKRAVSNESVPSKRRKSTPRRKQEILGSGKKADPGTVNIEEQHSATSDEAESSDEEEKDEFVDADYSTTVQVSDHVEIDRIIETRLRLMKQTACKAVAKPWIKAKEPTKQTKHPYNGGSRKKEASSIFGNDNAGELTKPLWWPRTKGWPTEGCRHKEPDHLKKDERVALLKHMLKICPVATLKDSTNEVLSKIKPLARDHLREIYRLREKQERYENKEIDATTLIHVEVLPTTKHKGARPAKASKKQRRNVRTPTSPGSTSKDKPKGLPPSDRASDLEAPRQEATREHRSLGDLSDQVYKAVSQPQSAEEQACQALKPEAKEAFRPTSLARNRPLFLSLRHETVAAEPQRLVYPNIDPAQLSVPSLVGPQADARPLDSCENAYNIRFGHNLDHPHNHGLPHEALWPGLNQSGSLAHTDPGATITNATNQRTSFFNEDYVFGNTSMDNPYRGSIDDEFPNPLMGGRYEHYWNAQWPRP